ncbi:MAG: hypothetical protein ABTQ73_12790 [Caldilineales bacterium]
MSRKATQKTPPDHDDLHPFWIDPDVEVAITAQINEHFPPEGAQLDLAELKTPPALMGRYNRGEAREVDVARSFGEDEAAA